MNGPTWADVASGKPPTERRDVLSNSSVFECPFCKRHGTNRLLKRVAGHRCICGALFYTQQAVAVHFKERG